MSTQSWTLFAAMRADADPTTVLRTGDPRKKASAARGFHAAVTQGARVTPSAPPDRPARPDRPELVPARQLAKRKLGSAEGRAALLHAIAHIELNAIDLAADMIARFGQDPSLDGVREDFVQDWSSVCDDEARHFAMIADRLESLGFHYGAFPAHGGLWDAAMNTSHDIAARLAIAPLVLEARGLDVTPGMITKLDQAGDRESADILRVIYDEEVGHVRIGLRWFKHVAQDRQADPESMFGDLVRAHHVGVLKPPFNHPAREKAGFPSTYYAQFAE